MASDVPAELMAMADGWHHNARQQYRGFVQGLRHHIAMATEGESEKEAEKTRKIMMVKMAEMLETTIECAHEGEIQDEEGNPAPPEIRAMLRKSVTQNMVQLATLALFESALGEERQDESVAEVAMLNNLFEQESDGGSS